MAKKSTATMRPNVGQLKTSQLHPYAAFQLYDWDSAVAAKPDLKALAGDIAQLLKSDPSNGIQIVASSELPQASISGWALHFSKHSQAPWTDDQNVYNVEQHVLLLVEHDLILGMSTSASEVRDRVGQLLRSKSGLTPMSAIDLETALLRSAQLRTLWLTGIHRRSPFKADSKVLTGIQLQTALSPLDDRTFRPSSGRADTGLAGPTGLSKIGVSPRRSYAWIGPSKDIGDFASRYKSLVRHINSRRSKPLDPLPILAQALPKRPAAGSVFGAFDFTFIPLETAADLDEETKLHLEAFEANLGLTTTVSAADQNFTLRINDREHENPYRPGKDWSVEVTVDLATASATAARSNDSNNWPRWPEFERLLRDSSLWSVWYESKHSLAGGEWSMLDARTSSFEGTITEFDFAAAKWEIASEKPMGGKKGRTVLWKVIGADKSLFSWWINCGMAACFPKFNSASDPNSFGIAICDDGANELADFVVVAKHKDFATPHNPSDLAFIMVHIKSSSCSKAGRSIAPKQYEEVLGQATKNLGRVQFPDTSAYLLKRLGRGMAMMWEWSSDKFNVILDRGKQLAPKSPIRMNLQALDDKRFHLHVVVIQPHQSASTFRSSMNQTPVPFSTRMLCTLLCAADGAARASSAQFSVVMSP